MPGENHGIEMSNVVGIYSLLGFAYLSLSTDDISTFETT